MVGFSRQRAAALLDGEDVVEDAVDGDEYDGDDDEGNGGDLEHDEDVSGEAEDERDFVVVGLLSTALVMLACTSTVSGGDASGFGVDAVSMTRLA